MKIQQCSNGHFIDIEKYDACPVCGVKMNDREEKKSHSLGSMIKEITKGSKSGVGIGKSFSISPIHDEIDVSEFTTAEHVEKNTFNIDRKTQDDKTLGLWDVCDSNGTGDYGFVYAVSNTENDIIEHNTEEPSEGFAGEFENNVEDAKAETETENLSKIISSVSESSLGKTVGYFESRVQKQEQSRVKKHIDPVVGWLVCVAGPHFGDSFVIAAGGNSIGRSIENRIVISDDNSVSSNKHAVLTYEPKKGKFYVKPGEGSGLTYVNDDAVLEATEIRSGDLIEIGSSKLMLVPLCGDSFNWSEYINE